jgi:hypothetical protein
VKLLTETLCSRRRAFRVTADFLESAKGLSARSYCAREPGEMNTVALPSSIPACAGRAPQVAARQQAVGSRPQAHATVRAVTAKGGRSVPE